MAHRYGFVKAKLASAPTLKPSRRKHEVQYHEHFRLKVGDGTWDVAMNVGTNDSDDLLKYKLVFDFRAPLIQSLATADQGPRDLTGTTGAPALDFLRGDVLDNTGPWRDSDIMDGTNAPEPVASIRRLLTRALQEERDVYVFGRFFDTGDGIHDTHMNQGSKAPFIHRPDDDSNDHNDVWQDGGLLVDLGQPEWAAYFAAFTQQLIPTDDLGNPTDDARPIA